MAYTNIDDPSAYFQTAIYAGNNSFPRTITNDGNVDMQPDFVWVKQRTTSTNHFLYDSSRTFNANGELASNATGIEGSFNNNLYGYLSGATSDGFTITEGSTNGDDFNQSSRNYVAWQWKANGGTTATNTTGSVDSVVQANQDAGFSIVTFTSASSGVFSVGHGLGVLPAMIIVKNREAASQWRVWHKDLTNLVTSVVSLNRTDAIENYSEFWGAGVTSSVFGSKTGMSVDASDSYIAYCFAEKQGYSKFGSYVGNGNANGPFIYTGFKPAWIMLKPSSAADNWIIVDNKRDPSNGTNAAQKRLFADTTGAEGTGYAVCDMLSNGFKMKATSTSWNGNDRTYIYMAFAENPFTTSTGIPTTAR